MIVIQEKQTGRRSVRVLTGEEPIATEYGFIESAKILEQIVEGDVVVWINDTKLKRLIQRAFQRQSGEAHAGYVRVRVTNVRVLREKDIS